MSQTNPPAVPDLTPTPDSNLATRIRAAADQVRAAGQIWIGTHREPDGDAIGSLLGLKWILEDLGAVVTVACQDPVPLELRFLPGVSIIQTGGPSGHGLAVAVDAGDRERLGDLTDAASWRSQPTLVLDHHVSNTGFGDINVIDPQAAATAEIILRLTDELGVQPNLRAATCLLTAIVTDTMGFRTANTAPTTLTAAQRLMVAGADLGAINQAVFYHQPLSALRLMGQALSRLEVRGRMALSALSIRDLEAAGATLAEVRGISSFLAGARELDAVAVLQEREDGTVDISMRARPGLDLVPTAAALGGGGHAQAAGARLESPLDAAVQAVWSALVAHLVWPSEAEASR